MKERTVDIKGVGHKRCQQQQACSYPQLAPIYAPHQRGNESPKRYGRSHEEQQNAPFFEQHGAVEIEDFTGTATKKHVEDDAVDVEPIELINLSVEHQHHHEQRHEGNKPGSGETRVAQSCQQGIAEERRQQQDGCVREARKGEERPARDVHHIDDGGAEDITKEHQCQHQGGKKVIEDALALML